MKRIGIVPSRHYKAGDSFTDSYNVINNYLKRINKENIIPYGVVFPDGIFNEKYLDIYDGFILEGGKNVCKYHFGIIDYAIKNNKPLIGICAGCQAIGIYSNLIEEIKKDKKEINYQNLCLYYDKLKKENNYYLKKTKNHNLMPDLLDKDIPKVSHKIYLNRDSIIYDILKKDVIVEPSIHSYALSKIGNDFKITGIYQDTIEVIEHKNKFILGMQFHPELEEKNQIIFDRFLDQI